MTYPGSPLGNQWSHPNLEADVDMHAKIDAQLNAARTAYLLSSIANMPRLRLAKRVSTSITHDAPIAFDTTIEDSASAWNATTHQWTCPKTGWYLVSGCLTANAAVTNGIAMTFFGIDSTLYGVGSIPSPNSYGTNAPNSCRMAGIPLHILSGAVCYWTSPVNTITNPAVGSINSHVFDYTWGVIYGLAPGT